MAKADKDVKGAHGLKRSEMRALHTAQTSGEEPKMIKANGKDAPADFKISANEAHLLHVELELPLFDQATGARKSTPFLQKYSPKEFEAAKLNGGFTGYVTKIFHAPKEAAEMLGEAAEGIRVVDTNYVYLQERYEALTGTKPEPTFTISQLDAAVKTAEHMKGLMGAPNLPNIDQKQAAPHVEPVVVGSAVERSLRSTEEPVTSKEQIAEAAKETAENHTPTNDGTTSVGQKTETVEEASGKKAEENPVPAAPTATTGRRGRRPSEATTPSE